MSTKKVPIGGRPSAKTAAATAADDWVQNRGDAGNSEEREPEKTPMKRLTFDIPEELHRQIKMQCAMRGTKIADELRELLREKYGNQ